MTDHEKCDLFKRLDAKYATPRNSPLHHDDRCPICRKG